MPKTLEFKLVFDQDLEKYLQDNYPNLRDYRVITKSLDARGAPKGVKPKFLYIIEALFEKEDQFSTFEELEKFSPLKNPPLIIGAGPAGLFCAVRLAEHGIHSIILERGGPAQKRMLLISKFWRYGVLDPDTNVCYGEGGAGLFSDGKLITRIKSNLVGYVMKKFVDFGAPADTAYTSNPHLGSNKIRQIITNMTDWLKSKNCEVRYNSMVCELLFKDNQVVGVKLKNGECLYSDHIVLASGHSATEMYSHLVEKNVAMKAKDFAVGVRVEHPRRYIDELQHGKFCEAKELGSARYRLSYFDRQSERGIYSFCMCPGGYVLSSGTEADGLVVNGMSNYARNSPWSNSAIVVSIKSGVDFKSEDLLSGLRFQHDLEKRSYALSKKVMTGRELPAVSMKEFFSRKLREQPLVKSSSPSHVFKANFRELFPEFIIKKLESGLEAFNRDLPGFITDQALMIAPETRTSSPLTILRDKKTLESISHKGLYPAGEGAGYAGGITSAAVDGVKIALEILSREHKST